MSGKSVPPVKPVSPLKGCPPSPGKSTNTGKSGLAGDAGGVSIKKVSKKAFKREEQSASMFFFYMKMTISLSFILTISQK
jgi:hypothetical protein